VPIIPIPRLNGEVRTAAAVHPNLAVAVSPGASFDASRSTTLSLQAHTTIAVDRADMPAAILGRTIHQLGSAAIAAATVTPIAVTALTHKKVCTATAVDPDPPAVITPGPALGTCGIAALFDHLHAAARVNWAIVPASVFRGAIDVLRGAKRRQRANHSHNETKIQVSSYAAHFRLLSLLPSVLLPSVGLRPTIF